MDFFGWFKKDSPQGMTQDEMKKKISEDTQVLSGLEALVQKINASNSQGGPPPGLTQEEYLARPRKEGKGL